MADELFVFQRIFHQIVSPLWLRLMHNWIILLMLNFLDFLFWLVVWLIVKFIVLKTILIQTISRFGHHWRISLLCAESTQNLLLTLMFFFIIISWNIFTRNHIFLHKILLPIFTQFPKIQPCYCILFLFFGTRNVFHHDMVVASEIILFIAFKPISCRFHIFVTTFLLLGKQVLFL